LSPDRSPGRSTLLVFAAIALAILLFVWMQPATEQPRATLGPGLGPGVDVAQPIVPVEPDSEHLKDPAETWPDEDVLPWTFRVVGTIVAPEGARDARFRIQLLQAWDGVPVVEGMHAPGRYRQDYRPARTLRGLSVIVQLDNPADPRQAIRRRAVILKHGVSTRVDFDLRESPSIRGRIVGPDGAPLAQIPLAAVPWTPWASMHGFILAMRKRWPQRKRCRRAMEPIA